MIKQLYKKIFTKKEEKPQKAKPIIEEKPITPAKKVKNLLTEDEEYIAICMLRDNVEFRNVDIEGLDENTKGLHAIPSYKIKGDIYFNNMKVAEFQNGNLELVILDSPTSSFISSWCSRIIKDKYKEEIKAANTEYREMWRETTPDIDDLISDTILVTCDFLFKLDDYREMFMEVAYDIYMKENHNAMVVMYVINDYVNDEIPFTSRKYFLNTDLRYYEADPAVFEKVLAETEDAGLYEILNGFYDNLRRIKNGT